MNRMLRQGAIAAAIVMLSAPAVAVTAVPAGSFDGATFELGYGVVNRNWPDWSFAFTPAAFPEVATITGQAAAVESANFADLGWQVNFAGSGVTFTYTGGADWMNYGNPKFNGLRIHDATGALPKILGVTVTTPGIGTNSPVVGARGFLLEGFNPTRDLQFDDDSIYVNLANGMWHEEVMGSMGCPRCDTIAFSVAFESAVPPPPVPEPSTYALMVAGLGVAAWGARRRRSRTAA